MTEQHANTYQFPASEETVVAYSSETSQSEIERARRQAFESAVGIHDIDPTDVDRRRIENFGASMVAATKQRDMPGEYFNPMNIQHLAACGARVVHIRSIAQQDSRVA